MCRRRGFGKFLTSCKNGSKLYWYKVDFRGQIAWYNEHVKECFSLQGDGDILAFVVISTPSYFEKFFIPFVCKDSSSDIPTQDVYDRSIKTCLRETIEDLNEKNISILYDYEMTPGTRRPKVLVQTAGHVSGAVYFYQKDYIVDSPWPSDKAVYGVCLHPKYVGWFALRAVIIFNNILIPELPQKLPTDILGDRSKVIELLNRYNSNWRDWSFRDVVQPVERYSELQKQYFSTKPAERSELIEKIKRDFNK